MRSETMNIHAGERMDRAYGAISPPVYMTSTFAFDDIGKTKGYDYSRTSNPTRKILEDTMAQLEGGRLCLRHRHGRRDHRAAPAQDW